LRPRVLRERQGQDQSAEDGSARQKSDLRTYRQTTTATSRESPRIERAEDTALRAYENSATSRFPTGRPSTRGRGSSARRE
jgi:hypothetical protein